MKKISLVLLVVAAVICFNCYAQKSTKDEKCVVETIMARRSVRKYKAQNVEKEKLEKIVECGINAPNGMNWQPWQIRVVSDKDYIDALTQEFIRLNPEIVASDADFKNMFRNAPVVIFVAAPKDGSGNIDCGMLAENMIITAQAMGLGTCCMRSPVFFMNATPSVAKYVEKLDIASDYELLLAIGVGYPEEKPDAKERDKSKVVFVDFNK